MDDIIRSKTGNCIVFAHHTEYLKHLKRHFQEKFPNRPVYIITGEEVLKKRLKIIEQMLTDKDAILCASYGCCSTGITFKNIDYGIFAQSFKSQIINKQALGRGLCLANDKDKYRLYDLIDCFPTKKLYMQGVAKAKLFKKENFEFYIKEIK
jgi:superfamily II DNA or RNA helicase